MYDIRNKILLKTSAFTLTEMIVTIVLIGVVIGFAIPKYNKSMERTYEADARKQLNAIHEASCLYHAKTGSFWPPDNGHDIDSINANLSLNILENGMTYNCDGDGTDFTCTATRNPPATSFTLRTKSYTEVQTKPGFYRCLADTHGSPYFRDNPCCSAGACPTLSGCTY